MFGTLEFGSSHRRRRFISIAGLARFGIGTAVNPINRELRSTGFFTRAKLVFALAQVVVRIELIGSHSWQLKFIKARVSYSSIVAGFALLRVIFVNCHI